MAIQALWNGGTESLQMTFLGQAAVLGQFQHPNILRLEGVVTKSRPLMVLTELMELGPLDSFLRVSRPGGRQRALGLGRCAILDGSRGRALYLCSLLSTCSSPQPPLPGHFLISKCPALSC